jgi:thiol-disulfide isomerase/thioredoxin
MLLQESKGPAGTRPKVRFAEVGTAVLISDSYETPLDLHDMSFRIARMIRIRGTGSGVSTGRAILILLGVILGPCTVGAVDRPAHLVVHEKPRPVPDISFTDETGGALNLSDFRDRVIVLNVWATWCFPCREEMPSLDRLHSKFDPRDVAVIALSIDRRGLSAVRKFFDEVGVRNLSLHNDESAQALRDLGLVGLPGTLVIDRAGREIGRLVGGAEWDSPEMVEFLKSQVEPTPQGAAPKQANAR